MVSSMTHPILLLDLIYLEKTSFEYLQSFTLSWKSSGMGTSWTLVGHLAITFLRSTSKTSTNTPYIT